MPKIDWDELELGQTISGKDELEDALNSIDPATLTQSEWLECMMAWHYEHGDYATFDSWSAQDAERYDEDENRKRWDSITDDASNPTTGKTIFKYAYESGWKGASTTHHSHNRTQSPPKSKSKSKSEKLDVPIVRKLENVIPAVLKNVSLPDMMRMQIDAMFDPADLVNIVIRWEANKQGKPCPSGYGLTRPATEHADFAEGRLAAVDADAGAWIRVNALDGNGIGNKNAVKFRHVLIEQDPDNAADMTEEERQQELRRQHQLILSLNLPCACIVASGGKSIHAIVRVDAKDAEEYKERVRWLFAFCEANGMGKLDENNKNVSRLSRLAGARRGNRVQRLIATNVGAASWDEFRKWVDENAVTQDEENAEEPEDAAEFKPEYLTMAELIEMAKKKPESDWLLRGVYARGDVVLITGLSGLGKTHLVMELGTAHAVGGEVLGHRAKKARVLAIDPEMRAEGLSQRMDKVARHYNATGNEPFTYMCTRLAPKNLKDIDNFLTAMKSELKPDVLILDSISAITALDGLDENDNPAVTMFLIDVKKMAARHNCAVIMMHHPPKNAGMAYSNSGTLIRGAEAWRAGADNVFELMPLKVEEGSGAWELQKTYGWTSTDEYGESVRRYPTAVRLQCTKFRYDHKPKPINMLFRPPIHIVDPTGELAECKPAFDRPSDIGGQSTKEKNAERRKTEEEAIADIIRELESEGTKANGENIARELNRWRKDNGNKRAVSADTLERYCRAGAKRKYFSIDCDEDGIFTVCEDEPEGTNHAA